MRYLLSHYLVACIVSFKKLNLFAVKSGLYHSSVFVGALSTDITMISAENRERRLRQSLWSFFAGDALAMPTHWYYGGYRQIQRDYSETGITGYRQPVQRLPGSILNKSNLNGGGRGSYGKTSQGISIIGDVINHGKESYWDPSKEIHYHATLKRGENTLEAQLARILMKSIVEQKGSFDADHFRDAYIRFMTTPGSHNDTYASTCHRMFFANLILKKLPPTDCPDNDHHNVDTIDGLVLPTITALAVAASSTSSNRENMTRIAADAAAATAAVTRKSDRLEHVSRIWSQLVVSSILDEDDTEFEAQILESAKALGIRRMPSLTSPDEMTACYLDTSVPSTLHMVAKYISKTLDRGSGVRLWDALLANANVGGENVHRGSILGAVLGARAQSSNPDIEKVKDGLYHRQELEREIDAFVKAVVNKSCVSTTK
jgi:ADP-ribosyl-[dinitrogen reductase] hydrolase